MTDISSSLKWNVHAAEFTPAGPALRPEAPEFVPSLTPVQAEVRLLVEEAGLAGVRVSALPGRYAAKFGKTIDLSHSPFADLSLLVSCLDDVVLTDDILDPPVRTFAEAMQLAGFFVSADDLVDIDTSADEGVTEGTITIGQDGAKRARSAHYVHFVAELAAFKEAIVDVVVNFASKNTGHGATGLALSLFAAEWDRFHIVRGIDQADLRSLRDRFGAVKLMPFLQAIPELDVVGTHPEVRVRVKPGVSHGRSIAPSPRTSTTKRASTSWFPGSPNNSSTNDGHSFSAPRNISLNSELFGGATPPTSASSSMLLSAPPTPASGAPEAQTRVVLEQMLASTQTQILAILSQVPADPLAAAAAIEQMNQLQILVNALKAALAVLPPPTPSRKIAIDDALFGSRPSTTRSEAPSRLSSANRRPLQLDAMLNLPPHSPPASPLSAAANAGTGVGPLLADLSRILFAQVIQQQQPTPVPAAAETTAALERTLAEIISAASTPICTPPGSPAGPIVVGELIIPSSLPSSPIPMASGSAGSTPTPMDQLLRGLMAAIPQQEVSPPPPGLAPRRRFQPLTNPEETNVDDRVYGKS